MNLEEFPDPPGYEPGSETLIQRLADGALTDEERARLLRRLDFDEPDRWRDLALALLEARLLAEAFQRRDQAAPRLRIAKAQPRHSWALAACLLIGAFLGLAIAPKTTRSPVVQNAPLESTPTAEAKPDAPDPLHAVEAGREGSVADGKPDAPYPTVRVEGLAPSGMDIPVLSSSDQALPPNEALHAATEPARRMQRAFNDRGLNTSIATSYVSADLEDGRHLLIPVSRLTAPRP